LQQHDGSRHPAEAGAATALRLGVVAACRGSTIWEAIVNLVNHEGMEISGYVSFMAILALFPFLIFVVAIAGFIGQAEGAGKFISLAFQFIPPEVAKVLAPTISNIVTHPRGDLLTFGILFAIWSASSGVEALRLLLNRCYAVPETRSVYLLRLQSVLLVVLSAIAVAILSFAIVLAPVIERFSPIFTSTSWSIRMPGSGCATVPSSPRP
jgi:Predicted membrane protein